ncbi:MAG: hypothetical protein R6V83_13965 [Candidatus Thorarchaeota archaeon]
MSNNNETDIVTKSEEDDAGMKRITTTITFQHGSSISIESLWKSNQSESELEKIDTLIRIGAFSISLPRGPTLRVHSNLTQKNQNSSLRVSSEANSSEHTQRRVTKVHMVTRHDGVEVFLDPLSAAFWAGNSRDVKEVSLRTAAFVLKADTNSVIESAIRASEKTWEQIDVILSIVSLAKQLNECISDMGISIDELTEGLKAVEIFNDGNTPQSKE